MMRGMDGLLAVSEAHLQHSQATLRGIAAKEAQVRGKLNALAQVQAESRVAQDDFSMRALGVDFLWQGWVARQREALHMQLANLLVAKADASARARSAFGKHQAIERVCHTALEARRKHRSELETSRLLDIANMAFHARRN